MRFLLILSTAICGCTSYGVTENAATPQVSHETSYTLDTFASRAYNDENSLLVTFSGGGSRAATLAYGVLQELRDTPVTVAGEGKRLLDEVKVISSVSGGSFTAAYYGLYGDGIFEDFENVFLRRNVQRSLIGGILNPMRWFSPTGRTELAVQFYEDTIFEGATFRDMLKRDGPLIMINASDLGYGARFTFIQEYFTLLCSDILSFPVSRAVTASSAVPLLFNPVVLKNHDGCGAKPPPWLNELQLRSIDDAELKMTLQGLESYLDKDQRKYAHLVDGGITDNLGLRAIYDVVTLSGGPNAMLQRFDRHPPKRLIVLSVNAATSPKLLMDQSNKQPTLTESANAMSDIQLHRYNAATTNLIRASLKKWATELSRPGKQVQSYFIDLDFRSVKVQQLRDLLNLTPTSFSLTNEQVDRLINTGRQLLREHPEFKRLLADIRG